MSHGSRGIQSPLGSMLRMRLPGNGRSCGTARGLDMIHRHSPGSTRRLTLGADKGYDASQFVAALRHACVTPHIAQKSRSSAVDGRTTRHEGYALSIKHRKRIEEAFGWAKTVGGMAQTVYRGVERVRSRFIMTMAANNLARLPRLLAA